MKVLLRYYKVTLLLLLLIIWSSYKAQAIENPVEKPQAVSIQIIGLAFHPLAGTWPELYPLRLDKNAYFVIELGAAVQYRYFFSPRWSVNTAVALYYDCAAVPAGLIHFGVGYDLIQRKKHTLNVDIGPSLLFREDWHQFPDYTGDTFFGDRVYKGYQYRFYPVIEIEYGYRFHPNWQFFYSVLPGGLYVATHSVGLRYFW